MHKLVYGGLFSLVLLFGSLQVVQAQDFPETSIETKISETLHDLKIHSQNLMNELEELKEKQKISLTQLNDLNTSLQNTETQFQNCAQKLSNTERELSQKKLQVNRLRLVLILLITVLVVTRVVLIILRFKGIKIPYLMNLIL